MVIFLSMISVRFLVAEDIFTQLAVNWICVRKKREKLWRKLARSIYIEIIKPKMVLCDYGRTLMYEPDFCPSAGNAAIYPYISENPHNISLQEFSDYLLNLFDEIRALRGELIEIHEYTFLRYVLEHFNMKLSFSIEDAEWIMWNGISRGSGIAAMM